MRIARILVPRAIAAQRIAFLIGGVSILAMLFFWLWSEVAAGHLAKIDNSILLAFRSSSNPNILSGPDWLPDILRAITILGDSKLLIVLVILVAAYLVVRRTYYFALALLAPTVGGMVIVSLLKDHFSRSRPEVVEHLTTQYSMSFPSGHAANSAIVYLTMAMLFTQIRPERHAGIYLVSAALLLTATIGISRVALGVHWPSDVVAGWMFGLSWGYFWVLLTTSFRKK
jgi:undecaprenyl-diphosphatase|tara:strand:- start:993 stop:1676 length:684 start_codon:yes stop_codon:yes gene_type:complete